MKRRILPALCVLALLALSPMVGAAAQQEAVRLPSCRIEGHFLGDGLDHNRPESCWTKGHHNCDGMDHEQAVCRQFHHFNCDGRSHEPAACGAEGHFVCDRQTHEAGACGTAGHCVSDGRVHAAAACGIAGHYACDGLQHAAAACGKPGHTLCDGLTHERAACGVRGHYACDGLAHERAACGIYGHCIADGAAHVDALCGYAGHTLCDGRDHEPAACGVEGHYACEVRAHLDKPISKYCSAVPQHMVCQGDQQHYCDPAQGGCGDTYWCSHSNAHTACRMCGLLWCDRSLGGHETPCGNANHRPCVYAMNGKTYRRAEHEVCGYCGGFKCQNDGKHGNGKCCKTCDQCGGPEKLGVSHKAPCGVHYGCITKGSHKKCKTCGYFECSDEHEALCGTPAEKA